MAGLNDLHAMITRTLQVLPRLQDEAIKSGDYSKVEAANGTADRLSALADQHINAQQQEPMVEAPTAPAPEEQPINPAIGLTEPFKPPTIEPPAAPAKPYLGHLGLISEKVKDQESLARSEAKNFASLISQRAVNTGDSELERDANILIQSIGRPEYKTDRLASDFKELASRSFTKPGELEMSMYPATLKRLNDAVAAKRTVETEVTGSQAGIPQAVKDLLGRADEAENVPPGATIFEKRSAENLAKKLRGQASTLESQQEPLPTDLGGSPAEATREARVAYEEGAPGRAYAQALGSGRALGPAPTDKELNDLVKASNDHLGGDPAQVLQSASRYAKADTDADEKEFLRRVGVELGAKPNLFTVENLIQSIFFGAPSVFKSWSADMARYEQGQRTIGREIFSAGETAKRAAASQAAATARQERTIAHQSAVANARNAIADVASRIKLVGLRDKKEAGRLYGHFKALHDELTSADNGLRNASQQAQMGTMTQDEYRARETKAVSNIQRITADMHSLYEQ